MVWRLILKYPTIFKRKYGYFTIYIVKKNIITANDTFGQTILHLYFKLPQKNFFPLHKTT